MSANGSAIPGDHQMTDEVKGKGKAVDSHDDMMMDDDDEDEEESGPEDGAPEEEGDNEDLEDEELDLSNVLDKRTRGQAGETTNYGEVEKKLKDDAEPSWGDDDEDDDDDFVDPDEEGEDKEMGG